MNHVTAIHRNQTSIQAKVSDYIRKHEARYIGIVRDLLRVPGISTTGEGMAESAEACLAHL
ncbi:hypothetical protein ACFXG4_51185, partial [Nocardia sp. NPDC059246]|uniref:hypothetical protein n=1 Tax=unclassified Nocardia TaxID=2637762 RepID=UPI00369FE8AC